MKKTIFFVYAGLVVGLLAIFAFIRLSSYHAVAFTISQPGLKVQVFRQLDDKKTEQVAEFTSTTELTLENGSYRYIATGEHIASTVNNFEVNGRQAINVKPDFDKTYLAELLAPEQEALTAAIARSDPRITVYYTINKGELLGQGEWYGTTLTDKKADPAQPSDFYRILMKKQDGKWALIGKPRLVLSAPDYPDVPKEILSRINQFDPTQTVQDMSKADPN